MFGNLDLNEMMKQLQDSMSGSEENEYSAKSGGGMVEVKVNGKLEVIDITIDESLFEDKESLQILLISGVNDAIKMAVEDKKSQALGMFGNMNNFGK